MLKYISLILAGVLLNAAAQALLKKGMLTVGYFEFSLANFVPVAWRVGTNAFIIAGLSCYVISVGIWMMVLSRVDVSFAYPFLSVGYVVVAVVGYYYFNETIDMNRLFGIALICLGVVFLSRSY